MKYGFIPKIFATICVLFLSITLLIGQVRKQMNVPNHNQETGTWCWAACMEMIMDYHFPNNPNKLTQCDIVKQQALIRYPSTRAKNAINSADCCKYCEQGCPESSCSDNTLWLVTLPFLKQSNPRETDYYGLVFDQNNFNATQKVNWSFDPMSWNEIKQQIEDCRPFILNINATPDTAIRNDHAVVVTSYQERLNSEDEIIREVQVNDPWMPCCDNSHLSILPYSAFTVPSSVVYKVWSTVEDIYPDTIFSATSDISNCLSCDFLVETYSTIDGLSHEVEVEEQQDTLLGFNFTQSPKRQNEEPDDLLSIVNRNASRVAGFQNMQLREDELKELQFNEAYYYAPVEYINTNIVRGNSFLARLCPPKKLSKILLKDHPKVIEMVSSPVNENIVTTFQKNESGAWKVRRISNYTALSDDLSISIKNSERNIELRNTPNSIDNPTNANFTLVRYIPFNYEFFKFESDGKTYLSPVQNYDDLELYEGIGYSERQFLRTIRKDYKIYERIQEALTTNRTFLKYLRRNGNLSQGRIRDRE